MKMPLLGKIKLAKVGALNAVGVLQSRFGMLMTLF